MRGFEALTRGSRDRQIQTRQLGIDHAGELFERLRSRQEAPVDEKAGRPGDAQRFCFGDVRIDRALDAGRIESRLELLCIQAKLPRVLNEEGARQLLLIREELVVILPELPLLEGGDRGHRRRHRVLMEIKRIVLEDDPHRVAVSLVYALEGRTDPPTEGSLEIREFDDRDRRLLSTPERRAVRLDRVLPIWIRAALSRC